MDARRAESETHTQKNEADAARLRDEIYAIHQTELADAAKRRVVAQMSSQTAVLCAARSNINDAIAAAQRTLDATGTSPVAGTAAANATTVINATAAAADDVTTFDAAVDAMYATVVTAVDSTFCAILLSKQNRHDLIKQLSDEDHWNNVRRDWRTSIQSIRQTALAMQAATTATAPTDNIIINADAAAAPGGATAGDVALLLKSLI